MKAADRFGKRVRSALIVNFGPGAVDRDLNRIEAETTLADFEFFQRILVDQRAVAQDVVAHAVGDHAVHQLKEIGADERLAAAQSGVYDPDLSQLNEKFQPGFIRQ